MGGVAHGSLVLAMGCEEAGRVVGEHLRRLGWGPFITEDVQTHEGNRLGLIWGVTDPFPGSPELYAYGNDGAVLVRLEEIAPRSTKLEVQAMGGAVPLVGKDARNSDIVDKVLACFST